MHLKWQQGGPFPYIGIWENDCIKFEEWCLVSEDPEIVAVIKRRRDSGTGIIYFSLYAYKVTRGSQPTTAAMLSTPAANGSLKRLKATASAFFGSVDPHDLQTLKTVMETE